jgi:formylglycine-generating enzyme required for sulfatase activity
VAPPELGTITVDVVPADLGAAWQLLGPGGFQHEGGGVAEVSGLAAGDYTLTWVEQAGWTAPASLTRALAAGGTLTFVGLWVEGTGAPAGCVMIPAGSFTMGCSREEPWFPEIELPHRVTLTTDFAIGATEVTNQSYRDLAQWACDHGFATATETAVTDALDGSTAVLLDLNAAGTEIVWHDGGLTCRNPDDPVKGVTWYGAAAFCDWRNLNEGLARAYDHATWACNPAAGYRLPTEAEWEYACRAGSATALANGPLTYPALEPLDPGLDALGWYGGNAGGRTHRIAEKQPNAWGLYDMHGNVCEWCNDWIDDYGGAATDPVGPATGTHRVVRGGGWYYYARYCRSAYRNYGLPAYAGEHVGFRCVRSFT